MLTFKQFLAEKISTSNVGRAILRQIHDHWRKDYEAFYKRNIKHLSVYHYKKDQDYKIDEAERILDRTRVESWIDEYLRTIFNAVCNEAFKDWKSSWGQVGVKVWFEPLRKETTEGTWFSSTRNIFINPKYLKQMTKALLDDLSDAFINSGYDEDVHLDMPSNFESALDKAVEILVHEVTHAHQSYRVKNKEAQTYYSYLIKNKDKFYDMIRNEYGEHYEAYLASPGEIEAFAQELVHRMMKGMHIEDPSYILQYLKDFLDDFNSSVQWDSAPYDKFKGSDRKVFIKARQRFLKKVYKEIDQRYEDMKKEVEEERKKEEHRQKELEAEYA